MIYALHGFLGMPDDWTTLLQAADLPHAVFAEDVFNAGPIDDMWSWGERFNRKAAAAPAPRVVMGYSMGGRLAMHALMLQPDMWDAAIIISAHGGLATEAERQQRRLADEQWARRFAEEPWQPLMQAWNGRQVFSGEGFRFARHEADYDRTKLAAALRQWSLGRQDDLLPRLAQIQVPILWLTGADDDNYVQQAKKVVLKHPLSKIAHIPKAGHRLAWQQPQEFISEVTHFLTQL